MGCRKSNFNREVYSNTILPQGTRKTLKHQIDKITLHLKQLEKRTEKLQN